MFCVCYSCTFVVYGVLKFSIVKTERCCSDVQNTLKYSVSQNNVPTYSDLQNTSKCSVDQKIIHVGTVTIRIPLSIL